MGPKPRPGIDEIELYQGGKSSLVGVNRPIKLSSNENPFGAGPAAREAYRALADKMELYPSADHRALREAIGEVHDLDPERIVIGAGSDEIISLLCYAYTGPGTEVLYSRYGFLMYPISARAAGATPVRAEEDGRTVDPQVIIDAMTEATRVVFIANPNNPTGTLISRDAVTAIADALPEGALLVLDGAYAEFVESPDYDAGEYLAGSRDNVLMMRTFSKVHGLGALRVGWAYGPRAVIDTLNRMRGPFNASGPGLATAEAAIRDRKFITDCVAHNTRWRSWLAEELDKIGIPSDASEANFLLARFADEATARSADEHLQKAGIIVRHVASYGLAECLRITIGDQDACKTVVRHLSDFMQGGRI